jgi:hypothetical protein
VGRGETPIEHNRNNVKTYFRLWEFFLLTVLLPDQEGNRRNGNLQSSSTPVSCTLRRGKRLGSVLFMMRTMGLGEDLCSWLCSVLLSSKKSPPQQQCVGAERILVCVYYNRKSLIVTVDAVTPVRKMVSPDTSDTSVPPSCAEIVTFAAKLSVEIARLHKSIRS